MAISLRLFSDDARLTYLMRLIPQTCAGIEIAGNDLRIAVVRNFAGKRRLLYTETVKDLTEVVRNKLRGLNVHVTFQGGSGIIRDLEFPVAPGLEVNLRSAVALQVESLSPWPLDEIYWDCAWEPVGKGRSTIVVHVGIVPREVVDPWIGRFRAAGLALTGASLSSLSWAHGTVTLWGSAKPALVVTTEKEHVEGALVRDGHIYAVRMEGENPAELATACASQLMRAGRVESPEQLHIVAPGLEPVPVPLEGTTADQDSFCAICTALLGLTRSGFRLNLIPRPLRYQRNRLQLVPTHVLVVLLVLLGVAAFLREPYQQSLYASRLDQEVKRVATEVRSVADQENQLNRTADHLKALNTLVASRDRNLEALRELSRLLPPGTFLTSYSYQDNAVNISGYSDGAAAVQKAFEGSAILHDAQFTSSITRDASGKDRFTLKASVEMRQ